MEALPGRRRRLRAAVGARPSLAAFAGVFAATLTAFLAIGAVLPVLPRYVRGPIGAGDLAVGIVVGAFAFSAIAGRPFGGRLADERGRRRVVLAGLAITAVGGALYFLPAGVPGLVLARLVLGVGDGWVFTAGLSWAVDLAPEERRGQAIGMFGLAIWGGLAAGPLLGEGIYSLGGYDAVFAATVVLPLLGMVIARAIPDSHMPVAAPRGRGSLVPRGVIAPGAALALANVGYGAVAGFIVLHLADAGIGHGVAAFTTFASAVVVSRLVLGRLPDVLGPRVTAAGAGAVEAIGLVALAQAESLPVALAAAALTGLGFSLLFPSLALIAVTRTAPAQRGAAIGAFTAFFDLGVGLGAPLAGAVAASSGYGAAFMTAAAFAAAGVVVVALFARTTSVPPAGPPAPEPV